MPTTRTLVVFVVVVALLALVSLTPPPVRAGEQNDADRAALLAGIDALDRPGVPGNLVVFGDDAFAVVTGGRQPEPVVAAARHGKGRVVAMAHSGYLDAAALRRDGDSRGRLLRNAIAWVAPPGGGRIGIIGEDAALAAALRDAGFDVREHADPAHAKRRAALYVWKNGADRDGLADDVERAVRGGAGLVSAACPWGWAQVRAARGVTVRGDLPENHALAAMGLVYADGTVDATRDGRYATALSRPDAAHAGAALHDLAAGVKGAGDRAYLVERALRALPPTDTRFLPAVRAAVARVPRDVFPRPDRPLGQDRPLARLAVTVRSLAWHDLPAEEVAASPSAAVFPGAVPDDAPRAAVTVAADPSVRGRQGTGLYAPPGELVRIRAAKGGSSEGWRLRVGCHSDRLWNLPRWKRDPEITTVVDLRAGEALVATPWGGPLYLEATPSATPGRIVIEGAVAAPRYVLGDEDSAARWKQSRAAPAPWAELEGRHVVLTVPSSVVRALDDPAPILEFWDSVLASHCELAGTPLPRRRERFVPDAQISAGYMHAGYPIMTWMDVVTPPEGRALPPILDVPFLREHGAWGYFHELGHNRQRPWWNFRGTTEVTCNLFSLYTHETLFGITPWDHPWLARQKAAARAYLENGAPFEEWRRRPGVALVAFAQIQRAFGWEPYRTVFADMEKLPDASRPPGDQACLDELVRRLSLACGHDLRPFWRSWGAPLGAKLLSDESLSALPAFDADRHDLR